MMGRSAVGSNAKPSDFHSKKDCACGDHNNHNSKKKRTHNSTRQKNNVRESRRAKEANWNKYIEAYYKEIDRIHKGGAV